MNSQEYWAKREAEALKHRITDEAEYDRYIKRIYSDMLDACQSEINAFYGKYAAKEGITLAEAKKKVAKLDIAAYERKAKRYVRDKDFSAKANEEMRLYNAAMKINRLEMLKANIGLELISGHAELEKFMDGVLQGRTEDELKRQAGILGKTVKNNAAKAHAIVNGSFHSGTFSDRIWQYQDLMREDLGKVLTDGLIRGKNPRAIAKDMRKVFYGGDPKKVGGYRYCIERLMRTELARVQTEAQKQSFVRNGFEQYTFIVNGGCCDICEGLAGKHFPVAKMMPGENAPPMHPHCRCSTAAYSDRKEYEEWLDFLDKGGTTEEYNEQKAAAAMMTERRKQRMAARQARSATSSANRLENCKTVADVEALMRDNDWFIHGTGSLEGWRSDDNLTLDGCDLDSAKTVYKGYETLFDKYPQMKGKLSAPTTALLERKTYAQSTMGFGAECMTVNKLHFKNYERLSKSLWEDAEAGFHPVGVPHSIVVHELGHALDGYLAASEHLFGANGKGKNDFVSNKIRAKVLREAGLKVEDIGKEVSDYATKNPHEWWAECFAEYLCSDSPRKCATEFGKMLDEIMKGIK